MNNKNLLGHLKTILCLFKYLKIFFSISVTKKKAMVRKLFNLGVNLNEKNWKYLGFSVNDFEQ